MWFPTKPLLLTIRLIDRFTAFIMATSEPRRMKLSQECERIEEDCDCGRKTMWNERDALISRVNTLQHISTSIKALQTALGTGALLQAIKGLNLGEWPLASVTVVSLPLLYVVEALLKTDFHRSWGEQCHNLASEYDALWVQTRFFRENRLPYCELDDATARVEEFQHRRQDINRRRPQTLYDPASWTKAQAGRNVGESSYAVDRVQEASTSNSSS